MSNDDEGHVRLIKAFPNWWPIVAASFGMIAIAAQAYAKISDHSQRLTDLEQAQPAIARELRDVNVNIARLEGKIDTLNERETTIR